MFFSMFFKSIFVADAIFVADVEIFQQQLKCFIVSGKNLSEKCPPNQGTSCKETSCTISNSNSNSNFPEHRKVLSSDFCLDRNFAIRILIQATGFNFPIIPPISLPKFYFEEKLSSKIHQPILSLLCDHCHTVQVINYKRNLSFSCWMCF